MVLLKWIADALKKVVEFLVSLPGMIVTMLASIGAMIEGIWSWVDDYFADNALTSSVSNAISGFTEVINDLLAQFPIFHTLSWVGALDVLWDLVFTLCGLWVTLILGLVLATAASFVTIVVAVLSYRLVCKIISLICPFVK